MTVVDPPTGQEAPTQPNPTQIAINQSFRKLFHVRLEKESLPTHGGAGGEGGGKVRNEGLRVEEERVKLKGVGDRRARKMGL